jgi:hypothetical protein
MTTASNLYAEKVFAEHPVALWTFDDTVDYVSLISEVNRDMNNASWTISGGTLQSTPSQLISKSEPFSNSAKSYVDNNSDTVTLTSPNIFNSGNVVAGLTKFSVGFYMYYFFQNIKSVTLQYKIDGTLQGTAVDLGMPSADNWTFLGTTFTLPSGFTDTVKNVQVVIKITYRVGTEVSPVSFNGISVGQNCEEFISDSLGVYPTSVPSSIEIAKTGLKAITAGVYGIEDLPAYYLVKNNKILAQNTGLPLVYGATNLTSISPNTSGDPSMLIPGRGFLNESGKYRSYTAELWLRVNTNAHVPKRIFGPTTTSDGLYVEQGFLTFKVGKYSISHYVSEWYRPMLVHLSVSKNSMSLTINGELVEKIDIDIDSVALSQYSYVSSDMATYNGDWLGIYAYDDVLQVEIDCFGIYPYQIPTPVAKRRWIYGQAVDFPENINTSYSGKSVYIDYPFANYSKNYMYPDIGKWSQGVLENISTDNKYLSSYKYPAPKLVFKDATSKTEESWYQSLSDNAVANSTAIKLENNSYLYFDKVSLLNQNVKAIYGVFRITVGKIASLYEEVLFKILDPITGNYFIANLTGSETLGYSLKYSFYTKRTTSIETVYQESLLTVAGTDSPQYSGSGSYFSAGLNFEKFSDYFDNSLSVFFGSKSRLKVFVGNSESFSEPFIGYIERFGLLTDKNLTKASTLFNPDTGVALQDASVLQILNAEGGVPSTEWTGDYDTLDGGNNPEAISDLLLSEHIASYTLYPKMFYENFVLDIATDCYWEDYVPLSYLGKEIVNGSGNKEFDIDLIQFNIDYPKPLIESDESLLKMQSQMVKTYISFQPLKSSSKVEFKKTFADTINITSQDNIVVPSGLDWEDTKYEVADGSVIAPPSEFPSGITIKDLAIVVHIEMTVDGINTRPIKIRRLQLASKSLNANSFNEIGTRFGNNVYPYSRTSDNENPVYSYKNYNTYSISKTTKPYLYLTRNSGIQPMGDLSGGLSGIGMTLNKEQDADFGLSAIQFAMRIDSFDTIPTAKKFLEVLYDGSIVTFSLQTIDNGRVKITSNSDKVEIYVNGKYAKTAVISSNIWNMITFGFVDSLDFAGASGNINITWAVTINNLSYFRETSLQKILAGTNRQWFGVKYGADNDGTPETFEWSDWKGINKATISSASVSGSDIVYTVTYGDVPFVVDDVVTVEGFTNTSFNVLNKVIKAADATTFTVANSTGASGTGVTAGTDKTAYSYTWEDMLVISSSKYVGVNATELYKSYTGTNKIIAESSQSLNPSGFKYTIYQNLSTVTKTVTPL